MTPWDAQGPAAGQPGWPPYGPPAGGPWPGPHGLPPGFPGPVYPWPYGYGHPPRRTNGLAVASMVLGIVWVYWIGSILALVLGYVARSQIRERGESGDGMAIAGIVLGWVGVGILGLALVTAIAAG
ncbi:protein of unknown function [Geodermatophilus dictyosporus]|uniref:DUF4190 domain-containing protein n=1 Tax=Geodermatophilus dictyosporus TaxID=1523247 RepID=A0A1I5S5R2_9ACTN|nr:DUF4190 domain-containing protein [Geodermatophilus dictyosporus]SFP66123.1 protein of unknown function [Geodermatophilus dictyosporus]